MHALFYVLNSNFSWSNLISFASKLHLPFINCKWMSFIILNPHHLVSFTQACCLCRMASTHPVPPHKGQDTSAGTHVSIFLFSLDDTRQRGKDHRRGKNHTAQLRKVNACNRTGALAHRLPLTPSWAKWEEPHHHTLTVTRGVSHKVIYLIPTTKRQKETNLLVVQLFVTQVEYI